MCLRILWSFPVPQLVKNLPERQETQSLGWEKSPGEGRGYPLQYSGLTEQDVHFNVPAEENKILVLENPVWLPTLYLDATGFLLVGNLWTKQKEEFL